MLSSGQGLHTQRIREYTDLNIDFRDTSEKMRGRTCSRNDVSHSCAVLEVTSLIHVSVVRRSRDAEAAVRQSRADRLGDDPGEGIEAREEKREVKDKEESQRRSVIETRVVEHVERYG